MEISAVVAAVVDTVAAASAAEIATAVALTGLGTSVVGMATGNKVMRQVGMGLSIAGSVAGPGGT